MTTGCAPSTCSRAATASFAASSSTASARSTPVTGEQLGGQSYLHASAEAQFPLPVVPESFGLRGAVFADAATVFGNDITKQHRRLTIAGTGMEWRASVGAGLIWASPFGPLRVDYAYPVLKEENDDVQNFNFGISTRF